MSMWSPGGAARAARLSHQTLLSLSAALVLAFGTAAGRASGNTRTLTFEDRVKAQEAIERAYYSHRIGAVQPFEEAVPREVIDGKVRRYLRLSEALEKIWKAPVTAAMLEGETKRLAQGTRHPERLREIQAALGNDPVLFAETYARQVLVERLARNFFASDDRIHAKARKEAETLRERLISGAIDAGAPHPQSRVVVLRRGSGGEELSPKEFRRYRALVPSEVGVVGPVVEQREAFSVSVVLAESDDAFETATFHSPKVSWSHWWTGVEGELDEMAARQVVHAGIGIPISNGRPSPSKEDRQACSLTVDATNTEAEDALTCLGHWDNGVLDDLPDPRTGHAAVWTGTEMIVWGGSSDDGSLNNGSRYNPVTETWSSVSTTGAPGGGSAIWTGTEMIVGLGRYNPSTGTWTPISTTGAMGGELRVWTGTEMIVWSGYGRTGARYDPATDTWTPLPITNAPERRSGATAVWTGTEMIVWGGRDLRTGGRYNPATDTWAPTSIDGAPQSTFGHTAVWTGTEMIVWGGWDLRTGGRYDPTTDTWVPTSLLNAPDDRHDHTAIWTGAEMIVWGGRASGDPSGSGGRYNPTTDTWAPTSTIGIPQGCRGHSVIWTGTEMIVWGGFGVHGRYFNTGGRYNPTTDTWVATSTNNLEGRTTHTTVWTGTEMIVWGGRGGTPDFEAGPFDTGGRYDPTADAWVPTSTTNAPEGRAEHSGVWTGTEMIVWGGTRRYKLNTGGRYDPMTDTWVPTSTTDAPDHRASHDAIWTGTEMIVWGGEGGDDYPLKTGGRYDPTTDSWLPTSTTNAPAGRISHTTIWTGTEMIVWGGLRDGVSGGRYDPATDTWSPTSIIGAPAGRDLHTAVWTGTEMIVWGGSVGGPPFNTGGRYNPTTDSWSPTSVIDAPVGRDFSTSVWTGTEMIVWGGYRDGYMSTGGRYNPATDTWTPTSIVDTPQGRYRQTAVWTGTQMIVWGGYRHTASLNSGGRYTPGVVKDVDGDGFTNCAGDCDDANRAVYPGAVETCNRLDDDCDGLIDEDASGLDSDGDGVDDTCDNCGAAPNPDQIDADMDGAGDLCDVCPLDPLDDADGDGACGDVDECGGSDLRPTLAIAGCETGAPNALHEGGCSLQDLVDRCGAGAAIHGRFASCLALLINDLRERGLLTGREQGQILRCAN